MGTPFVALASTTGVRTMDHVGSRPNTIVFMTLIVSCNCWPFFSETPSPYDDGRQYPPTLFIPHQLKEPHLENPRVETLPTPTSEDFVNVGPMEGVQYGNIEDNQRKDISQRQRRAANCYFNAGLGHNCDFQDALGAVGESAFWGSGSPGKRSPSEDLFMTRVGKDHLKRAKNLFMTRVGRSKAANDLFMTRVGRDPSKFANDLFMTRVGRSNQNLLMTRMGRGESGTKRDAMTKMFNTRIG